jgi:hypothetical protein
MKRRQQQREMIIGIGTIGILLIAGAVWYFGKDYRYENFTNKDLKFSVDYPATWSYRENIDGANVIFYSPMEHQGDFFTENSNGVVQTIDPAKTILKDYSELAIHQMKLVFGLNLEIKEAEETTFAGRLGYKFFFTGHGPQTDMQFYMYWTIKDDHAYQFTFLVQDGKFEQYKDKFNKMSKSFKILP